VRCNCAQRMVTCSRAWTVKFSLPDG